MDNLFRINIKIFTPAPPKTNFESFLMIFTNWKEQEDHWLDIADYLHMIDGPGVVLYGNKCFVSIDNTDGLTGILYANRSSLEGDLKQRIQTVLNDAFESTKKILKDELCPKEISSSVDKLEITINDRKNAPPTSETEKTMEPVIKAILSLQFGEGAFQMEKIADKNRLFGYQVSLKESLTLK